MFKRIATSFVATAALVLATTGTVGTISSAASPEETSVTVAMDVLDCC